MPLYREFAGLGGMCRLPDRVSILRFRHLLEQHELAVLISGDRQRPAQCERRHAQGRSGGRCNTDCSRRARPRTRAVSVIQKCIEPRRGMNGVCHERRLSLRCCTEDGRRPPGVGLQERAPNRPVLLRSKGVGVSDRGKSSAENERYVPRR